MSSEERFRIAAPGVIHQSIEGEVMLIHLSRGTYHNLGGCAVLLFEALLAGASERELVAVLLAKTDATAPIIEDAVQRLVRELLRDGLVTSALEPMPAEFAPPQSGPRVPFEAPFLETFTDLQDLLTADPVHDVEPSGWPNVAKQSPS